jgi:hypothetical protein
MVHCEEDRFSISIVSPCPTNRAFLQSKAISQDKQIVSGIFTELGKIGNFA